MGVSGTHFIRALVCCGALSAAVSCATAAGSPSPIPSPRIYGIKAPAAGNYPQGLFQYRFKAGYGSMETEIETFTQTLEWSPAVPKTFATDTQYTAILTLDPAGSRYCFTETAIDEIRGLPVEGVQNITASVTDGSLVITIVFERTAGQAAPAMIIFEDEFNGTSLDTDKWEPAPEYDTGFDTGRSTWKSDMVSVDGGYLHIKFRRDSALGKTKTMDHVRADNWLRSGAVFSGRQQWPHGTLFENTYGYYEARVKVPAVQGTWCAFWLPSPTQSIFWEATGTETAVAASIRAAGRDGTEIDIFESIGGENGRYSAALHWNGYGSFQKSAVRNGDAPLPVNIYDGEFHIFALDWSPSEYVFYVDGREFWRTDGGPQSGNSGINQNPNYIALSAEGAVWAGFLPEDFTEDEMLVDYVRVYNQPRTGN